MGGMAAADTTAAADQAPQPSPMALYVGGPRTGRQGGSTLGPLFLRRWTRFRPGLQEPLSPATRSATATSTTFRPTMVLRPFPPRPDRSLRPRFESGVSEASVLCASWSSKANFFIIIALLSWICIPEMCVIVFICVFFFIFFTPISKVLFGWGFTMWSVALLLMLKESVTWFSKSLRLFHSDSSHSDLVII